MVGKNREFCHQSRIITGMGQDQSVIKKIIEILVPTSFLGELSVYVSESQSSFTSDGRSSAAECIGLETVVVTLCVDAAIVIAGLLSD